MPRKKAQTWETEQAQFPSRLSEIMKEKKVSQETLASAIGVKRQTVSLYKTGQSSPNAEQLCKIAHFFSISADWLLGISETKSQDSDIQQICKQTGISEDIVNWLRICSKGQQNKQSNSQIINNFNIFFQESGEELFEFLVNLNWYAEYSKSTVKTCNDIKRALKKSQEADDLSLVDLEDWMEQLPLMMKEIRYKRFECIDSLTKRFDTTFECNSVEKLLQETIKLISDGIEDNMCWYCE